MDKVASRTLILAVLLVVVLGLGASLVGTRVFLGTDSLESFAPWRSAPPDGVVVTNRLVGDTIDAVMPTRAVFRDGLYNREIAGWDSYSIGGVPLASVPNGAVFSPLNIGYWVLPLWYAPAFAKLLEIIVAIGFMWLFLRRIGLRSAAAMMGSLVYAFSGFQTVWTNWPQSHVGALIPAFFWSIEYSLDRRRPVAYGTTALVLLVMWLEGFPAVTGYALMFGGAYAILRSMTRDGWIARFRGLGALGVSVLVGTAVAAFQLMPFLAGLGEISATRQQDPSFNLPMRAIATLATPDAFGSPAGSAWYGPLNYMEIQLFLGVGALVLVALSLAGGTRVTRYRGVYWWFVATVVVVMVLLFVGGPLLEIFQATPVFAVNFVGRLRSVLLFLLAVLAAVGYQTLIDRVLGLRKRDVYVLASALLLIWLPISWASYRAWQMARAAEETSYLTSKFTFSVVALLVALVAVAACFSARERIVRVGVIAFPVLVAIEIGVLIGGFWPQVPLDEFYPRTDTHEFIAERLGRERVVAGELALYPGTTAFYGIRSVAGRGFHPPEWREMLLAADPNVFRASPTFSIMAASPGVMKSPILDRLAARFYVVDPVVPIDGVAEPPGGSGSVELLPGDTVELGLVPDDIVGIVLGIPMGIDPGEAADSIVVELIDSRGVKATSGYRRFDLPYPAGNLEVGLPLGGSGGGPYRARVMIVGDTPISIGTRADGAIAVGIIRSEPESNLKLVFAGSTNIYERTSALPRYRWASSGTVLSDKQERIQSLASDIDATTVVLNDGLPISGGGTATILDVEESANRRRIEVNASGRGYLVVADSLAGNWIARIDGREVPILKADHALAAVVVEPGLHVVEFLYAPQGGKTGARVTVIALMVVALIGLGDLWWHAVRVGPDGEIRRRSFGRKET